MATRTTTTRSRGDAQLQPSPESGSPRLPHERDESHDDAGDATRDVIRQAHDDLASGKVDTDRGAVTDAVYRRQKTGDKASDKAKAAAKPRDGKR